MTAPSLGLRHTMVLSFANFKLGFGLSLCSGNEGDLHFHACRIPVGLRALFWFALLHFSVVNISHRDHISILVAGDKVAKVGWLHSSLSTPSVCKVATLSL